jgi:hypothetical protein
VFVDLNGRANLSGEAGHPNDAGMATIADTIYGSMQAHAVPEPGTLSMVVAAAALVVGWSLRRRGIR